MIVLSGGLPKSASGYYFNLTNDLLVACGHQDIRELGEKNNLEKILRVVNCNIGEPTCENMVPLLKLHNPEFPNLKELIGQPIFQDPIVEFANLSKLLDE